MTFFIFCLSWTYNERDNFQESEDNDDFEELWTHEKCACVSKGKLSYILRHRTIETEMLNTQTRTNGKYSIFPFIVAVQFQDCNERNADHLRRH